MGVLGNLRLYRSVPPDRALLIAIGAVAPDDTGMAGCNIPVGSYRFTWTCYVAVFSPGGLGLRRSDGACELGDLNAVADMINGADGSDRHPT